VASEKLKLFSKIELELQASAQGTFSILTDLPGYAMAQRFSFAVPASGTRRPVTSRLPYNLQGHLVQAKYTPGTGQSSLYRVRIWGRELPGGQWQWYELPAVETPVEFRPAPLPVPPTPEEWQAASLPIPATAEEWKAEALPIPPTSEEWRPAPLPIPPTSEEWKAEALPIPPTGEEWHVVSLPVKPTPEIPDWSDLEVDK